MSEEQFVYNVHLLENIDGIEALVDASKLEYLDGDVWRPLSEFGIQYMPIILYTSHSIDKELSELSYTLRYELLIPHVKVTPKYIEKIIICASSKEELPFKKMYKKQNNQNCYEDTIRYNNEGINTLSKVKSSLVMNEYITKNRRRLYEMANIIGISINSNADKIKELNH